MVFLVVGPLRSDTPLEPYWFIFFSVFFWVVRSVYPPPTLLVVLPLIKKKFMCFRFFKCNNGYLRLVYTMNLSLNTQIVDFLFIWNTGCYIFPVGQTFCPMGVPLIPSLGLPPPHPHRPHLSLIYGHTLDTLLGMLNWKTLLRIFHFAVKSSTASL